MTKLTPSELKDALECCVRAKRPSMVWGDMGIGKSEIHRQVAEALDHDFCDLRLTGRDTVDLIGLPRIENGMTQWATPSFLPRPGKRPWLLFLDEINRANQAMLNMSLQLVLDRRLGDYTLPSDCVVLCAGNYESDPGVIRMSGAMKQRLEHLHLTADVTEWLKWAVQNGLEPSTIAFIQFRPELLHRFDPKELCSPNPRAWKFVSDILWAGPKPNVERAQVEGHVGEAVAGEFAGFRRLYKNLPNMANILLHPKTAPVPDVTEVSTMYAIAAALSRKADPSNFGRIITYMNRLPKEFGTLCIHMATADQNRAKTLIATPEYTNWTIENEAA